MEFFGLDIGSYKIKVAQLRRGTNNKYQLVSLGSTPSFGKGLLSDAESDLNSLSEIIKKLHKESKITTKSVVSALPQDQVFTKMVTFPKLSEEELESALRWEAEQYVPLPLEEVTLAHQVVGQTTIEGKEKTEVILVAAPNRLIEKVFKVISAAGLELVSLETEIFSLSRSLIFSDSEILMLVDLGARATDLAVIERGQVIFTYSLTTAGESLTRAVALELGLEPTQAEAFKRAYGVDPEKLEGKVKGAIGPILDIIIKEMEKTLHFFQSKNKMIKRVILSGGTAGLPEVSILLAKKLNLEIQIGNPFCQIEESDLIKKIPPEELPFYASVIGLAMKEVE